ncbi:MAG: replicative DNA helicase, partial [Lachnospiraceae bacterium]|nr:replicative DNA helicase [Lachnospiraceae bacterium]
MDEREMLVPRTPPHSIEAEQSVIASMLYSADAIGDVAGILTSDDFYQHQYGIMYDTILELNEKGLPIDPVTLQNALKEKDVAPEVYSIDTLRELANQVFTTANAGSYAKIVADKALMRRMVTTFEGLTNQIYLGKDSAQRITENVEHQIFDLLEKRIKNATEPIDKIVVNTLNEIQEASKVKGGITGLETGFTRLDHFTNGFQKSNLIILAGRPAMGKTAFALNMAAHFAVKKGYPTVLFELE